MKEIVAQNLAQTSAKISFVDLSGIKRFTLSRVSMPLWVKLVQVKV
jgi:hypothetical protein